MEGHIADPVESVLHAPVAPLVGVEVFGSGQVGRQAGNAQDDFFAGPRAVHLTDVAAQAEDLAVAARLWDVSATLTGVAFDQFAAAA